MSLLSQFYPSGDNTIPIDVLIIGGGGGGGSANTNTGTSGGAGGGGGSSAYVYLSRLPVKTNTTNSIIIGSGGSGGSGGASQLGGNGSTSSFGLIESPGGSGGASQTIATGPLVKDSSGIYYGSGGGGADTGTSFTNAVELPLSLYNPNGLYFLYEHISSNIFSSLTIKARRGADGTSSIAGRGGGTATEGAMLGNEGTVNSITGVGVTYCEGGLGGDDNHPGLSGGANTGTGGGGAGGGTGAFPAGNGGSGVVIIAYADTYPAPSAITGTYNTPSRSGYRVYRFTGSGSITF